MSIRQRIIFLFFSTFVAIAIIGGFSVRQSSRNASEVKLVTYGVVPSAMASAELIGQLKDVQMAVMQMVEAPDMEFAKQSREKLIESKGRLEDALKLQHKMADSQAQRGLVEQAQESMANYYASIEDTTKFKLAGQMDLAQANLAATVNEYLREQEQIISTLQVEKRRSKDDAIVALNENLTNTTQAISLATLVAAALLTAISFLLYRQIIRPLGTMQQTMTEIAFSQDFSRRVHIDRHDEIGKSILAFNAMIEKIQESSILLEAKSADIRAMLQYIPQGILTIVQGGKVHNEYSAYLKTIFETEDIGGRSLMDLVFSGTPCGADALSQIETALDACVGEDGMNFEFNEHLLVTEIEKKMPGGQVKVLDLNWSPITDEHGIITRLMLCVRDVTELKALAVEAGQQKRELEIIGQILAINQEKFHEFIESAEKLIAENEHLLKEAQSKQSDATDPQTIAHLFRNMHTIKGNARTFGLLHMTNLVHEVEQTYDELRQNPQACWNLAQLLGQLVHVKVAIEEYAKINEVKLGRKGPGRRGGVEKFLMVQKDHIQQTIDLLETVDTSSSASAIDVVRRVHDSLQLIGTQNIQGILAGVLDSLPSLAKELGKPAPYISIQDNGIVIRNQIADLTRNVFMHLYRNAMDHGIEPASQRIAEGKSPAGHISLELCVRGRFFQLKLRDDGRGLAVDLLKQKAVEKGLIGAHQNLTPEQIAQLVFASGFSTSEKVTEVSGRGVGMDAVKAFVEREGGTIELCFLNAGQGEGFRPFETVISLPKSFAVQSNPKSEFNRFMSNIVPSQHPMPVDV